MSMSDRDGVIWYDGKLVPWREATTHVLTQIIRDMGLEIIEKRITRDEVYVADEVFFTGTAAEVTPIRELDRRPIGTGSCGPITTEIQRRYFDIVQGRNEKYSSWCTLI